MSAWAYDMENCPRKSDEWIFVAFDHGDRQEVRQARWSSDRWMTPAGFMSPKKAYAWTVALDPPDIEMADDRDPADDLV